MSSPGRWAERRRRCSGCEPAARREAVGLGNLRFAVMGCGFWSRYQIAGWREVGGVELVAVYNRTRSRAEAIAQQFGVPGAYDDAAALLANEQLDFVDIITDVDTHAHFVQLAASRGLPVICQKPLAPDLRTARDMVRHCQEAGVPLLVHENWRWQHPLRELKRALEDPELGPVHRARLTYANQQPCRSQPLIGCLNHRHDPLHQVRDVVFAAVAKASNGDGRRAVVGMAGVEEEAVRVNACCREHARPHSLDNVEVE